MVPYDLKLSRVTVNTLKRIIFQLHHAVECFISVIPQKYGSNCSILFIKNYRFFFSIYSIVMFTAVEHLQNNVCYSNYSHFFLSQVIKDKKKQQKQKAKSSVPMVKHF